MKRKSILMLSFIVVAIVGAFVFGRPNKSEAEIMLMKNVEALSDDEAEHDKGTCYNSIKSVSNCWVLYCGGCVKVEGTPTDFNDKGLCN